MRVEGSFQSGFLSYFVSTLLLIMSAFNQLFITEHDNSTSDANEQGMSEEEPIYHLRPTDLRLIKK